MCGIAGVVASKTSRKLIRLTVTMLQVLQTRGHESSGVAYSDGERLRIEKGMGMVNVVFHQERITTINKDKPVIIMGHNRYTTAGGSSLVNAHPLYLNLPGGRRVAMAINGNTPNLEEKWKPMKDSGARPFTDSDTEFILDFIVEASGRFLHNLVLGIEKFMKTIKSSYSGSLLVREKLYLFRDPYANRPLVYGKLDGIFAYASETAALEKIGVKKNKIKEVEPGTIMEVSVGGGVKVHRVFSENFCKKNCAHCIFCAIYFARPDR
jgi:amidophosphoribosyltransferase